VRASHLYFVQEAENHDQFKVLLLRRERVSLGWFLARPRRSSLGMETTLATQFPIGARLACNGDDAARAQVVLFGGRNSQGDLGDTWVWDGTNWTQSNPASSPPPRFGHAMAYDAARGQVVLFGGGNSQRFFGDTWVWDGNNWAQKNPGGSPPAQSYTAMAYDAARGQVVLFGGANAPDETWVWDGDNWTQKNPVNSPPAREAHAMAYDAARAQVVLFGGSPPLQPIPFQDSWVWDGDNWTQKNPTTSPAGRTNLALAYDAASSQTVLFGGVTVYFIPYRHSFYFQDTWAWNGNDWARKDLLGHPSGRVSPGMAGDSAHGQILLFGGAGPHAADNNDTWVWSAR
jgi:hypothetical protein